MQGTRGNSSPPQAVGFSCQEIHKNQPNIIVRLVLRSGQSVRSGGRDSVTEKEMFACCAALVSEQSAGNPA